MGKIKKILENELIGGTQSTDVYPITSTKAVYDTSNKVLDDYIQHLKKTSTFAGIATPTTNPGTPDGPVFYIATKAGTYANFNGISVADGEVAILEWKDGWTKKTTGLATEQEIIYDVSARNGGEVFESLQSLLSSSNLSTLIPTSVRHGGMSICFVQSSDNKYVQYRLMANTFSTNGYDWEEVGGAVTTAKIADGAVTSAKLAKGVIVQDIGSGEQSVMSQKAVSTKFSELSEINNSITKGKAVNGKGEIVDSNDYNVTMFYISIDNIKSFSVISQNIFPCLVYYDSNLKCISGVKAPTIDPVTFTDSVLKDKPSNAKYVRLCYKMEPFKLELYTGNPNINDNLIEFANNKIKTVSNDIKIKETVSLLTKGKYLDLKGKIANSNEFIATTFYISIDNIKSFSVVGQGTSLAIAYYDSNLKFISGIEGAGWGGSAFTESVLQDKPLNAKYVRFSSHTQIAPFKLELYTISPNINDSLIELVDNKITNKLTGTRAWENKTCAFLGDSITDKVHVGTTKNYWQFLGEILGISYVSYGINGAQSDSLINQATSAYNDNPNYDAIFILIGTNDFNANIEIGEWFTETEKETNKDGVLVNLKHRDIIINKRTFKSRLNTGLQYIKKKFPNSQVILMTPLHRAYAVFDPSNIQPDESYANTSGLFLSDYVAAIKECANIWATELIDLNAISGLYPLMEEYSGYFHNSKTDMLHPNINGHYRIAQAIAAKMNSISCLQKP